MHKTTYQTFPTSDLNLSPEAVDLFQRLRSDLNILLKKISEDAKSNPHIDMNSAVEEAYIRSLLVAGILMPLPENSALCIDTSNKVH
jgi:hypothetical protein